MTKYDSIKALIEALKQSKIKHMTRADSLFSCPASGDNRHFKFDGDAPCYCGASRHNAKIDAAIKAHKENY